MAIDAKIFDTLISSAPEIEKVFRIPPRRRLTPARILVLAMMSHSASRAQMRETARAIRTTSKYGAQIRRVHVHSRLCEILKDLQALEMVQAKRRCNGSLQFTLKAHVRRRMKTYVERAASAVQGAT